MRDAPFLVGRVLFDPHELVQELVNPEREPTELGMVQLESLVALPVQDGRRPSSSMPIGCEM